MQNRPQFDCFRVAKDSQGYVQQKKTRQDRTKQDEARTRQDKIGHGSSGQLRASLVSR